MGEEQYSNGFRREVLGRGHYSKRIMPEEGYSLQEVKSRIPDRRDSSPPAIPASSSSIHA
jgi:hypothetical protein